MRAGEPRSRSTEEATPPWYLIAGLAAIAGFGLWLADFSRSCSSDGCIGVIVPGAGLLLSLGLQLLVLLPLFIYRRHKARQPFASQAALWFGLSAGAFYLAVQLFL